LSPKIQLTPLATREAAPIPTRRAMSMRIEAIVVAEEVSSALTTVINDMPAIITITAIPSTYPRIDPHVGLTDWVWSNRI